MARTRSFDGVDGVVWERLKTQTRSEHGTLYEPPQGNAGLSTTGTALGAVVLAFEFRPAGRRLVYTIRQKPFLVSESAIWSGIAQAIARCQRGR